MGRCLGVGAYKVNESQSLLRTELEYRLNWQACIALRRCTAVVRRGGHGIQINKRIGFRDVTERLDSIGWTE